MNEQEKLKLENERLASELAAAQKQVRELEHIVARLTKGGHPKGAGPATPAQLASELDRVTEELSESKFRMECDLAVAREIQNKILPQRLPDLEGLRIHCLHRQSAVLGGDFYDIVLTDPGVVAVLMADASCTGLTAAIISVMAKMSFVHGITHHKNPKGVLREVNEHLRQRCMEGQFVAAFLGFIDLGTLRMRFTNAAMCPPVVSGPNRFEFLDTEGSFLGIFEDANLQEREVQLGEGDRIVFHTDGVARLFGANGKAGNAAQWQRLLRDQPVLSLDAVLREIDREAGRVAGTGGPADDVTVVGLELLPRQAHTERFVIMSDPQEIGNIETRILHAMDRRGYGERDRFGVKLALEEAVMNGIRHGNRMDRNKKVVIDFSINDRKLTIGVTDEGPGFDPNAVPDPLKGSNLERPSGRGIVLMKAYMDEVEYVRPGNKVVMTKRAPWA